MEYHKNPSKTLSLYPHHHHSYYYYYHHYYPTLFLLLLLLQARSVLCHSPTSPAAAGALRRALAGVFLGSAAGLLAAVTVLLLLRLFLLYANRTPVLRGAVVFSPAVPPKSLHLALAAGRHLPLGPGRYRRLAPDGDGDLVVAVKLVEPLGPDSTSSTRRAQRQLEALAKLKHRNVLALRAYDRDAGRLALVYDYCPCGSLDDAMKRVRAQQLSMGWEVRHRIAVGIAKGLRYLHFDFNGPTKILHFGLKPSNVLLDDDFEPRLGDCGLATLVVASGDATGAAYTAPECFQSCRYTDKSDIFSLGMILSVLLTGRDPSDPFFATEAGRGSLGRWLRHLQQAGEAREALDKAIVGEEVEEDEMLMAIRIALVCLSDLPADRPSSDELVAMLTQLHSF